MPDRTAPAPSAKLLWMVLFHSQSGPVRPASFRPVAPICFVLRNPLEERAAAELAAMQRRLAKKGPFGETLMRTYLTLLVDSPRFEDEAAPAFLVNPWTNEQLRPDRYYADGIIFEYNGPQHDRDALQKNPICDTMILPASEGVLPMRAFIYCRVSTEEQGRPDHYSLTTRK